MVRDDGILVPTAKHLHPHADRSGVLTVGHESDLGGDNGWRQQVDVGHVRVGVAPHHLHKRIKEMSVTKFKGFISKSSELKLNLLACFIKTLQY